MEVLFVILFTISALLFIVFCCSIMDNNKNEEGYKDLLKPELKGKIASCSPEASSSAYEHLVNALNAMGDGKPENGWGYIDKLIDNMEERIC